MSRISPGIMLIFIFAILFGLVGAYGMRRYFEKPQVVAEVKKAPAEKMQQLALAAADIAPGRTLRLGDVGTLRVTDEQLKKMKIKNEYLVNPQQIIGRIVKDPIKKGETFDPGKLYPEGMGPDISERLKPGFRAVTIDVKGAGILNGLASAGSMVDVLFRVKADATHEIPETTVTLVDGVEILAVDENMLPGSRNPSDVRTVTLAVNAQQANALKIAEARGDFSLSLRNPDDTTLVSHNGPQTLESLLNIPKKPPVAKPKTHTVEVYHGGSRSTITFEDKKVNDSGSGANGGGTPISTPVPVPSAANGGTTTTNVAVSPSNK